MKFDRQCGQQQTSWVVSYGGKTIPRWRTAAIFKIVISPYLSEKSSDFDELLYTTADFELDERHVIKNDSEFDRTYFLFVIILYTNVFLCAVFVKLTETQTSRTNFTTEQKVDFIIKVTEQQVPPLL